MIAKVSKGSGFLGILQYVMKEEKGQFLSTNLNINKGILPSEFAKRIASFKDLNPRVKKPVFHVAISLEKDAKIDDRTFNKLGNEFMNMYGFNAPGKGETPFVMVRHTDTDNPHIHIVASRIDSLGYAYNPSNDYKLINEISRKLEKEYGFKIVTTEQKKEKEIPRNELKMAERIRNEGGRYINNRKKLIDNIKPILESKEGKKIDFRFFIRELNKKGIAVQFNTDKEVTRINGISFSHNYKGKEIKYKGSALGKGYTWSAVLNRVEFKSEDMNLVKEIQNGNKDAIYSRELLNFSMSKNYDITISQAESVDNSTIVDIVSTKPAKIRFGSGQYREENNKKKKKRGPKLF